MNFQELMSRIADLDQPVKEASKPDYIDLDKDGNKTEPMKKAAKEKEKKVDEDIVDECGMPGMGGMPGGMMGNRQPDSVNMNVSLNASGAGGIRDLMGLLRNIEDGGHEEPVAIAIGPEHGHDKMPLEDFKNTPDEMYAGIDAVTRGGGDLNKPKKQFKHNYRGGDNPMAMAETIKQRLQGLYENVKSR